MTAIGGTVGIKGRQTARLARVAGISATLGLGVPAVATAAAEPPPLTEDRLFEVEKKVLGHAHALEHAMARGRARLTATRTRAAAAPTRARLLATGPANAVGRWLPPFRMDAVAIHTAVMPTGEVLYYAGRGYTYGNKAERAFLWNPKAPLVAGTNPKPVPPPIPGNNYTIFCSGQSLLADGRLLVTGGQIQSGTEKGAKTVYTFDPFSRTWKRHADMRGGRWYPSQALQPDGRTIVLSGTDATGSTMNQDVEIFNPATGITTVLGTYRTGEYYPHMMVMPSGRTLVAGALPADTFFLNVPSGRNSLTVTDLPNYPDGNKRSYATSVLLPGGPGGSRRAMVIGGRDYADASLGVKDPNAALRTTMVFDEGAAAPSWTVQPNALNVARAHHNTVLLPDSSMVTVGGGHGGGDHPKPIHAWDPARHAQVELYDPATGAWRLGPEQKERRTYHSTAVLLPDGRVLSAGDDGPEAYAGENPGTGTTDNFEIYEPPYLFAADGSKAPRPAITSAPAEVPYGAGFTVGSPAANVTRAVLMAPSATTHATDMSQRQIVLAAPVRRADGTGYDLTAPSGPNAAPPGYYMLFLLNSAGVPSEATFVRLVAGGGTTTPPAGQTVTFGAVADARVQEAYPATNYGTSTYLRTEGASDPDIESFVRFSTANLSGTVTRATLRLWAGADGTADGPALTPTTTTWTESGITWNTRPAATGAVLGDKGAVSPGTWVEYDVTSVVTGNDTFAFRLSSSSTDGMDFHSREGTTRPQLVVTTG